jgi:hypothetical protein
MSTPQALGLAPEPFDGSSENVENFWASLETYYHLNSATYDTNSKKVTAALTFFKVGTTAGAWAQERHKAAFTLNPPDFSTWDAFQTVFANHLILAESVLESTQQMHNLCMGNQDFNSWHQEWSTHVFRHR